MNRGLYQLSYAAMNGCANFGIAEISFISIPQETCFVKSFFGFSLFFRQYFF